MATPTLSAEVDFDVNPTASYFDTLLPATGLAGYWRFKSAASPLVDELALNNGVIEGTPSLVTGALPNDTDGAVTFNGTNTDVYVPSVPSLTPITLSVEGWVKVAALPGSTKVLMSKPGAYSVSVNSVGQIVFTVKNDATVVTVTSNTKILTGTYYHVVGTYDGATVTIYINGLAEASAAHTVGLESSAQPLRFAASLGTTVPVFQSAQGGSALAVTTLAVNSPASVAAGDLVVAQILCSGSTTVVTEPAGFVLVGIATGTTGVTRYYVKVSAGGEPATYTWGFSPSANVNIVHSRISGANSLAYLANPVYTAVQASGTAHPTGTHIPNVDNALVLAFASVSGATVTFTWSSGTTGYGVASNQSTGMAFQTGNTSASLAVTATASGGSLGSSAMMILAGTGLTYTACTLDEWSLWSRALTAAEALDHYVARLSGTPIWTDVTGDSREFGTKRGRQYELDKIEAGTGDHVLRDTSRVYDPANTQGSHYPNVIPKRRIRLRATATGSPIPILQGFIERWPTTWELPNYAEERLTFVDGAGPLNLAPVSGTLAASLAGVQIDTLLNQARWPKADRAIDTGLYTMEAWTLDTDAKALATIQEIAASEAGIFFVSAAGIATYHDGAHRWTATRSVTPQAVFSDANVGGVIKYTDLVPSLDDDECVNTWQIAIASGTVVTVSDVISARRSWPLQKSMSTRLRFAADALALGRSLLHDTARPGYRFDQLTVQPSTLADWQTVLSLEISDRVTVVRNPLPGVSGSPIQIDCFVEGIRVKARPTQWTVTFDLSPVSPASYYEMIIRDGPVSYWRLDTTT